MRYVIAGLMVLALPVAIALGLGGGERPRRLAWAPPRLVSPQRIALTPGRAHVKLAAGRDYVIELPRRALVARGGVVIVGGRNVVLIGGTISIPAQGSAARSQERRGLFLRDQTGTVHVEGVRITGPGLAEGIDLDQRFGATVQLQNIRVETVRTRDARGLAGAHPDLLQSWRGPRRLRIDGFTGATRYQGLFLLPGQFKGAPPVDEVSLRRVNIAAGRGSAYLLWRSHDFRPRLRDVWLEPTRGRPWSQALWPAPKAWPGARRGRPPGGDFVKRGQVGVGYVSPGYQ